MKKIISIVGTRPQFLKLAPLCKKINSLDTNTNLKITHIIIHSGQHYDDEMSGKLFATLNLPVPNYLLHINNGSHAELTGKMMIDIEKILIKESPNCVLVYGDCDTTLAGALVAKKLEIPLIHIESGMRSYNKSMPEEINRIVTDHISDVLLCSTFDSLENLKKENITKNLYYIGNLQLELLRLCLKNYNDINIIHENNLVIGEYVLLTIHRHYNTLPVQLQIIFEALSKINKKIIFPIHPRTKNIITKNNIIVPENIVMIKPVSYLDMIILQKNCSYIITDSGGVQPEAWYLDKKCLVIRSETEWIDALNSGNNRLMDLSKDKINDVLPEFLASPSTKFIYENDPSDKILEIISNMY